MKNIFSLSIFFTSLLLWGGEDIAIVKSVKGDVILKRDAKQLPIYKGGSLQSGDILQTPENSSIGLIFNDGTVISIGPKSMLVLNMYLFKPSADQYEFDVTLKTGTAVYESGKIGKLAPQKVSFKIPQGSIGVRGTKFIVDVEEQ